MNRRLGTVIAVTNDLSTDQRMQRACAALQGAGFDCLLVGRARRSSKPLSEQPFEQKRLRCWAERGPIFYVEFNVRLFFFLLFNDRSDCFCAVDLDTIAPVFFAGKLRRAALVHDAHEYFSEVPEVVGRPIVKRAWEAVAAFFIPKMDACLTVGPALAEALSKRYAKPFEVVRNVPFRREIIEKRPKTAPNGRKILLYQGALNEGRGLETALAAMARLPDGFELWLAGEGDLSASLRRQADELSLGGRAKFLGAVEPYRLPAVTERAWLGLNLLENRGLSYWFSLANKCFDYWQAGVPCLNMDFPEYRALNEQFEASVLMSELSSDELVRIISELSNDGERMLYLTKNARRAADVHCWENEAPILIETFKMAIERKKYR